MLKKTVDRYQHGSVRKVKRAQGFAWEFRYCVMEGSIANYGQKDNSNAISFD